MSEKISNKPQLNVVSETISLLVMTFATIKENLLLVLGAAAWWGSHYLVIFNTNLVERNSPISGFDRYWLISVMATVLMLGLISLMVRNRPGHVISNHRWVYPLICACVGLGLLAFLLSVNDMMMFAIIGAVLTGIGNSFCHIIFGEQHVKLGKPFILMACAIEVALGLLLWTLFSWVLPDVMLMVAIAFIALSCAMLYCYSRQNKQTTAAEPARPDLVDVGVTQLTVLAVLVGLTYGFVRTLMANNTKGIFNDAALLETLGTMLAVALLVIAFFIQRKRTLLELCFILVIPFVASGMLLIPIPNISGAIPIVISTGGFVCLFILLLYFAAVLSDGRKLKHITFLVALFFCFIQFGQMAGALVPTGFVNIFSTEILYSLVLVSALFFLRQRSRLRTQEAAVEPVEPVPISLLAAGLKLSARETEVLVLLMRRMPYRQIEKELIISSNTVKTHVRNIYRKADVQSRE
jgi:DNA-binding CsgD family transcriptional regulator